MNLVVQTSDLTKKYGDHTCVNRLHLEIPEKCIYGFLGPNGAGKSTTLKMLLGLVHPTEGDIRLFNEKMNSKALLPALKKTGSLIEAPSYYDHLTGRENLKIIATLKNVDTKQIDEVLNIVRLTDAADRKSRHYSLGMKQRLGIAGALLGYPKLLILDEPLNGLDPAGIQEMRELILSLPKQFNMTVIVSSHLLSEIDQVADYVGIINEGKLLYQGNLQELHEHNAGKNLEDIFLQMTGGNQNAIC